jgi:hypothetical protein
MKTGKNLLLDIDDSCEDFFEDAIIIGIVAPYKGYKFCLRLNKLLNFNFKLNTEIQILLRKKGREYSFPVYQSDVRHSCVKHYLYDNRNDGETLLPEFKNIDFIWLLKGASSYENQLNEMLQIINSLSGVQLATEIKPERLHNRQNLIF